VFDQLGAVMASVKMLWIISDGTGVSRKSLVVRLEAAKAENSAGLTMASTYTAYI
jgi:hypothetical protein